MLKTESFHVIGIAKRTSNAQGQSGTDIPALWQKFMSEKIIEKIPNKLSQDIYCVYTEYEGDHNQPFTTVLGCKVSSLDSIPEGCRGITIKNAKMKKHAAKGNLLQGAIWQEWVKIWESNLNRTYESDYEIYGEKAQNPEDAEVDIFVGVE